VTPEHSPRQRGNAVHVDTANRLPRSSSHLTGKKDRWDLMAGIIHTLLHGEG
jgi:hypothetical protein